MKVSTDWLSDYVALDGLSPEALADLLTMAGLEVESVERRGQGYDGVVVGHVLATRPHPNADRLTLCDVDLGAAGDGEPVQIVCGAPNVAAGQRVPVATVGTTLLVASREDPAVREPITLKKAKIRGEVSRGMICAEDELGLSEDHAGIMVLEKDAEVGQPFAEYLAARGRLRQDATLDIAITPNRPDAVSHLGVARDVAAVTERALTRPDVAVPEVGGEAAEQIAVEIEAPEACRRYVGLVVRGVTVGESPDWLRRRLEAVGARPINNVVDVTNYVMLECGQPLHAFDLDLLAGGGNAAAKIVVRRTADEHPFTTLDDQERTLPVGTLMICDAELEVAIAGVVGGANSEVNGATRNVLIESAYFDPTLIRQTAKALGLQTDASYRFERGVDPEGQPWAAARAAALVAEITGGEVVGGMVDAHPSPVARRTVPLRRSRLNRLLGTDIGAEEEHRLLTAIGFEVEEEGGVADALFARARRTAAPSPEQGDLGTVWRVPSFRPDVEREVDLIEEVARLHGYDRIPRRAQMTVPTVLRRPTLARRLREEAADRLVGLGFWEAFTNSLLPAATAEAFAEPALTGASAEAVVTANAINRDMAALRPSLIPGLLAVVAHNQNREGGPLRLFEVGHVFGRAGGTDHPVPGYREREMLALAISGPAVAGGWDAEPRAADFFDLKGIVQLLLGALGLGDVDETAEPAPDSLTAYRLVLEHGRERIGMVARVSDAVMEAQGLRDETFVAELDWGRIVAAVDREKTGYAPISRFPAVERDLAVTVPQAQPVGPMLGTIRAAGRPLLQRARVFDLYEGEGVGEGRKSVAFGLRFGADQTLTDKRVDKAVRKVVQALEREHGAALR